ncbi:response regulator transcription factor [Nocardioides sp. cx-173]|uniref:response regulator transcription factor n=1 Tax=Nocardioides sp. cx-173 TaxID=2898796 RepID=UPI001E3F8034|nr:response regulator transcription factor [Nocardioides sp. cx-173]MCD4527169.1 response regulator transcription factor [Nocardioides sp. cx-173]UGB40474.1 response regulator transcription factor [Nocardioides sp. cx-173]
MTVGPGPVRVALVNDYELVLLGLQSMLTPYAGRVVLVDTFARAEGPDLDPGALHLHTGAKVVLYSWHTSPHLVEAALAQGVDGYVSKGAPAEELVTALERIAAGEQVVPAPGPHLGADGSGTWPGQEELTAREAEVVALIAQGLANREIAGRVFLSINSIKSHIRSAYRKMGVSRRSQAVVWALQHGFAPAPRRPVSADQE